MPRRFDGSVSIVSLDVATSLRAEKFERYETHNGDSATRRDAGACETKRAQTAFSRRIDRMTLMATTRTWPPGEKVLETCPDNPSKCGPWVVWDIDHPRLGFADPVPNQAIAGICRVHGVRHNNGLKIGVWSFIRETPLGSGRPCINAMPAEPETSKLEAECSGQSSLWLWRADSVEDSSKSGH